VAVQLEGSLDEAITQARLAQEEAQRQVQIELTEAQKNFASRCNTGFHLLAVVLFVLTLFKTTFLIQFSSFLLTFFSSFKLCTWKKKPQCDLYLFRCINGLR
jgi:hypothetical protein